MGDIHILVSRINMKLRDDDYSLIHVLDMMDLNEKEFLEKLKDNDYFYDETQNQIKSL